MEKGEYKTGQLLDIKEKNGKLVREYVAGFFGDEPIIKQRLLTPQEARRYREDQERAKKGDGGAAEASGMKKPAGGLGRPGLKKRPAKPGEPVKKKKLIRKRRVPAEGEEGAAEEQVPAVSGGADSPAASTPSGSYNVQASNEDQAFVQKLIDDEPEKPNYNPANVQQAMNAIAKIGSPEMKIYRLGTQDGEKEGAFYTQKEFIVRDLVGLPMWKAKSEPEKPDEGETSETSEARTEEAETTPETAEAASSPHVPELEDNPTV